MSLSLLPRNVNNMELKIVRFLLFVAMFVNCRGVELLEPNITNQSRPVNVEFVMDYSVSLYDPVTWIGVNCTIRDVKRFHIYA